MRTLKSSLYNDELAVKTDIRADKKQTPLSTLTSSKNSVIYDYINDLLFYFGSKQLRLSSSLDISSLEIETTVTPANLLNRLIEKGLLPNYDPIDLLLAIESISPEALDLLRSITINRKYHSNPWYSHAQTDHSIDNLEDSANYVLLSELLNEQLILD